MHVLDEHTHDRTQCLLFGGYIAQNKRLRQETSIKQAPLSQKIALHTSKRFIVRSMQSNTRQQIPPFFDSEICPLKNKR
ncbi:hypothetical protein [Pseudomonas sp. NBRC 111133]|uniref:hypothetical protein n=1 Tax=Pseudomonas sp. NBRC 111133 TaxID=1661048 RepID=UPI0007613F58|nr:hypothetical protein [Pseudomonas sp. NBRC 111133]